MNELQRQRDYLALCEAKARMCRYLDSKNWPAYAALLTEDYQLDISEGTGIPVIQGREAALARVRASIESARTVHQVHAPEIEIEGDEARAIWALQDRLIFANGAGMSGYGHYHERWVRREGQWRIAALKLTRLLVEMQPPPQA
ncbi:SnoaL-like domain-containing protein [Solimonas aquatica]|uniref:SnoaL-like domain-containing protein n=1 Tax=Solimonas aquatica TaxID=489703 RepID=A0A1H9G1F8_9GAMM|nr:nuclear transport factor 2 family protein [Solimonas aquatica]SEQ43934.1 SnoaL-like domain-containing protein [Solimonas aquatica]